MESGIWSPSRASVAPETALLISTTQLGLVLGDDYADRKIPALAVANKLLDVWLRDRRLVLIVHDHHRVKRIPRSVAIREQVVAMLSQFVPDPNTGPGSDV